MQEEMQILILREMYQCIQSGNLNSAKRSPSVYLYIFCVYVFFFTSLTVVLKRLYKPFAWKGIVK
jgi:hypothetical protein